MNEVGTAQTIGAVWRAELFRLRKPGGIGAGIVVSVAIGVGLGVAIIAAMLSVAPEVSSVIVTSAIEAAVCVTAALAALSVATATARDSRGQFATALVLVPSRVRFFGGRTLAVITIGLIATALVAVLIATAAVVLAAGGAYVAEAAQTIALAALAAVWLMVMGCAVGALLRSSAIVVLVMASLILVLPMLISLGSMTLLAEFHDVLQNISAVLPGPLLVEAVSVTTVSELGGERIVIGQVGLLAWAVVTGVAAWLRVRRTDA